MSPFRFRNVFPIQSNFSERTILYDLERTFVFDIPNDFQSEFATWPPFEDITPETRQWLIEKDLITNSDKPNWSHDTFRDVPEVTDISIDLAGSCNMSCNYCFEDPINSRTGRMSDEVLLKTLDFAIDHSKDSRTLALHFGSGEPLLSFKKLRLLVEEARKRADLNSIDLSFELTTNATLVTSDIAKFLANNGFNVRVSFDGPKQIHDRFRPMKNGHRSYERVARGLLHLLEEMPNRTTVNSVICSDTRLIDIWDWAKELGIKQLHTIKVGASSDDEKKLKNKELEHYTQDLHTICREILSELEREHIPINFQPISKVIRRLMIPEPITRFCGVAGTYLGVSSTGSVFPCFRHLGLDEYHLGTVFGKINDDKRSEFRSKEAADVDNRPICKDCWARYICGGGCYADSTVYSKDKLSPISEHCPFWLAEIETGIDFYDFLRDLNPLYCLALFDRDTTRTLIGKIESPPSFLKRKKTF